MHIEHLIPVLHHNSFNQSTIEEFGDNLQHLIVNSASVNMPHILFIFLPPYLWDRVLDAGLLGQSMNVPNSVRHLATLSASAVQMRERTETAQGHFTSYSHSWGRKLGSTVLRILQVGGRGAPRRARG